jgi:hypothetical protein
MVQAARFEELTVGKMTVENDAVFEKTVVITGAQTNNNNMTINNLTIRTNLAYTASSGNATHNGNLTVNTNLSVSGNIAHSASSGNVVHNGNLTVNTNLAYSASSGNATHNGSLVVNTNFTFKGTMTVGVQPGWTGVITNKMDNYTNLTWVGYGVITNVTLIGALP